MEILSQSEFINRLKEDLDKAALIAIIGNGGSQASAIHTASDLIKRGYPVLDLNNACFITASSNDYGFENSYMQFFKKYNYNIDFGNKYRLILIILSVHGGKVLKNNKLWSENLYNAAKEAKKRRWKVITISGEIGEITKISDYSLIIYTGDVEAKQVEIMHEVLKHERR